jgi:hypothetical protein
MLKISKPEGASVDASASGSFASIERCVQNVCFTSNSGRNARRREPSRRAISGPSASQQILAYSITSSARKSIEVGSSTPIAFAVFKLTIISNFEACSTGRSAGFVPFKIFAT